MSLTVLKDAEQPLGIEGDSIDTHQNARGIYRGLP